MVQDERFSSTEPQVNFNRVYSDNTMSPAPADSHRNMSFGMGAFHQPFQQHFDGSPYPMACSPVPPSPVARGTGGFYGGMGDNEGGLGGNAPDPHRFDCNSTIISDAFAPSGQSGGHSDGPIQAMQRQIQVKDKVITELAGIVEMLEINHGITIDDQIDTCQELLKIARSMEEEACQAGSAASSSQTKGKHSRQ